MCTLRTSTYPAAADFLCVPLILCVFCCWLPVCASYSVCMSLFSKLKLGCEQKEASSEV